MSTTEFDGERKELISSLRRNKAPLANEAADMLEADAAFTPDWATYRQGVEDGKTDARVPMTEEQIDAVRDSHQCPASIICLSVWQLLGQLIWLVHQLFAVLERTQFLLLHWQQVLAI
jgi:hypothetical protein